MLCLHLKWFSRLCHRIVVYLRNITQQGHFNSMIRSSVWVVFFLLFVRMLSLLVNRLFLSCECGAVLFMVSSGSVCRQVVWRRSQVQTPTLVTLPVSSSSNTHLLFSFLTSSKMSWISQLYLFYSPFLPTQLQYTRDIFVSSTFYN